VKLVSSNVASTYCANVASTGALSIRKFAVRETGQLVRSRISSDDRHSDRSASITLTRVARAVGTTDATTTTNISTSAEIVTGNVECEFCRRQ